MAKREKSQLQSELAMLYGHTMILVEELRVARIPVPPSPQILGRGPIIPPYKNGYMSAPPGSSSGWNSFNQAPRPSQDLGYAPGTLGSVGPSISPFADDNDNDDDEDDDTNQYIRGDDSPQGQPFFVA